MADPTYPVAPNPIASRARPATFSADNDAALAWEAAFRNALSDSIPWFADAVSGVADASALAETSAAIATGAANYQGAYDAGTVYTVGQSVTYNGSQFVKKTTAPAGTTPVDGADWLGLGGGFTPTVEVFPVSGIWTKPSGCTLVYVELIGGGGSGALRPSVAGGGGGGGGYVDALFLASDLGTTETVTIAAGGAGVTASALTNGNDGGVSSFGAHLSAPGGKGAVSNKSGYDAFTGGTSSPMGTGGYASAAGGDGSYPPGDSALGGAGGGGGGPIFSGGTSYTAGDGGDGAEDANATDGSSPGGGGGGVKTTGGGTFTTGAGGDGWCRVTCW